MRFFLWVLRKRIQRLKKRLKKLQEIPKEIRKEIPQEAPKDNPHRLSIASLRMKSLCYWRNYDFIAVTIAWPVGTARGRGSVYYGCNPQLASLCDRDLFRRRRRSFLRREEDAGRLATPKLQAPPSISSGKTANGIQIQAQGAEARVPDRRILRTVFSAEGISCLG